MTGVGKRRHGEDRPAPRRRWRNIACGLLLGGLMLGCGESPEWRTRPLATDFPDLAFELVSEEGEAFTETRMQGHLTLLFFGYTSCPHVCPATLGRLKAALVRLPTVQRERVRVLFVSVDPGRDRPRRLADYTDRFGPRFIGATADIEGLERLTHRYGTSFRYGPRDQAGQYRVSHGDRVWVFDHGGRARLLLSPEHGIEEIAHDLAQLLSS